MTYSVDQCRRCGRSIPVAKGALARYEQSKHSPPAMKEEKWRAEGWKCAPTAYQIVNKLDGVCRECKPALMQRRYNQGSALALAFGAMAVFFGLIAFLFLVATPS